MMTKLPSTPIGRRRLLKLADLLEADASNERGVKFDLGTWARKLDRRSFPKHLKKLDCNTSACAVGLACLSGVFKEEGLHWVSLASEDENNIIPLFGIEEGFSAVQYFFGLTYRQSEWLFLDHEYPTEERQGQRGERAVAKRIRDFVAGKATPGSAP